MLMFQILKSKYLTTSDCNQFMSDTLDANIKNKEQVNKSGISGFIIDSDLNKKIKTLATKSE